MGLFGGVCPLGPVVIRLRKFVSQLRKGAVLQPGNGVSIFTCCHGHLLLLLALLLQLPRDWPSPLP